MTDLIDDEQNDHSDQQQWNTFQQILGRPWWGYAVSLFGVYLLTVGVPSILIVMGGGTTAISSSGMSTAYVLAGLIFLVMIASIGCAIFRDLLRKAGGSFPEPEQNPWRRRGWIMCGIGFGLFMLASFIELSRPSLANVDTEDWNRYRIGESEFEISIPPGWSYQQLPSGPSNGFVCSQDVSGSKIILACIGARNPDGRPADLDQFLDNVQSNIVSQFTSSKLIRRNITNALGAVIIESTYETMNGTTPFIVFDQAVKNDTAWAHVMIIIPQNVYAQAKPEMNQIMATLQAGRNSP